MPGKTQQIIEALESNPLVEVAWLYGSRAADTHSNASDYDLAVALADSTSRENRTLVVDDLEYSLQTGLKLPVSVVDINKVPVPLAQNIISQGVVLLCKSDFRLRAEQQRVWSLWEEYKFEHESNRKAL